MTKSAPVLPLKVTLHAMKDGKWVPIGLEETSPNLLKGTCIDSCARAKLTLENLKPLISYDQCKADWTKKHRDWDPKQFELRDGALTFTPTWMGEHPFWQLGPDPLKAALHGGTSMSVEKSNHNTHTSSLYACGKFTIGISTTKLVDLPTSEFMNFNPDGRSFRLKNPESKVRNIIVLYHQDPKKTNGRKENDPTKQKYWNPGDEKIGSPNYWQPLYSDGAAALLIPVQASKHGKVLTVGSRDNNPIHFNKEDTQLRLLGCESEEVGTITIELNSK